MIIKDDTLISLHKSIISFLLAFITLALLGHLLAFYLPSEANQPNESIRQLFLWPFGLAPENNERKIFLILVIAVIPISICSILITNQLEKISTGIVKEKLQVIFSLLFITLITPVIFIYKSQTDLLPVLQGDIKSHFGYLISTTTLICLCIYFNLQRFRYKRINVAFFLAIFLIICLAVFGYRIKTVQLLQGPWEDWSGINFEIILYSVSQTMGGKTLLKDLPAQYGLYGEILKPIYKFFGLSILSFTLSMTLLLIFSIMLMIWIVSTKLIQLPYLKYLSAISILMTMSVVWILIPTNPDFYLAYQPLRILFPSIYLAGVYFFLKKESKFSCLIIGSVACISIIWNLDTAVPIVGSFLLYLTAQLFYPLNKNRSETFKYILIFIFTIFFGVLLFALYLGKGMDVLNLPFSDLIKYQKLHYISGYNMLPMPRTLMHPWAIVISIYVFSIILFIRYRIKKQQFIFLNFIFICSICGIGLFAYYQGRSHIYNLIAVMWPAVIILFIYGDRSLRMVRCRQLPKLIGFLIATPSIFTAIFLLNILFVNTLPLTIGNLYDNYMLIKANHSTSITKNIAFIKNVAASSNEVAIYSTHQAVYFSETKLKSCTNGPGFFETHLIEDEINMLRQLSKNPSCLIFIDQTLMDGFYKKLGGEYLIKEDSGYGLLLLGKKTNLDK